MQPPEDDAVRQRGGLRKSCGTVASLRVTFVLMDLFVATIDGDEVAGSKKSGPSEPGLSVT